MTDKKISFQGDSNEKKKTQKISFYRYDKTAHQINKTANSKQNETSTQSFTIETPRLDTLRNEVFGTPRLPVIPDMLSSRNKSLDHETLHKNLLNMIKYANNLENMIQLRNKEVKRLEYLNKFLVVANEKREEMIAQTLKENQRLKELLVQAEKANHGSEKRILRSNKPANVFLSSPSPTYQKPSGLAHLRGFVSPKGPDRELIQILESNAGQKDQASTARSNMQQTLNKLFDSTKSESILKINELDAHLIHNEDQNIKLLQNLIKDEEYFFQSVRTWEDHNLIGVFDAIMNILKENQKLFEIVLKLKKILRAANNMMQSLVLTEAMEGIVEQVCECLYCDRATLWLVDEEKEELWSKVAKGSNDTIRIGWNKGIVGSVIQRKEPLNIINAYADDRFNREVDLKTNYKTNTILCVPILDDRRGTDTRNTPAIGVIQAINKFDGVFDKDDEGLLGILCNLAGVILKNSKYFGEEKMFHNKLRAILNTGIYLSSLSSIPRLLVQAEKRLQTIMNVEQAKIFLFDKEDNQLIHYTRDSGQECFPANSGVAGSVLAKGEYENVTNSYDHLLFNAKIDIDTKLPVVVWPIKHPTERRQTLGVFEVVNVRGIQGMAHSAKAKINIFDFESLEFFSKQLAQAILNISNSGQQIDSEIFSNAGNNRPLSRNHLSIPNNNKTPSQEIGVLSIEIKSDKNPQ